MTQYRAEDGAARPNGERRGSDLDLSIGQVLAATGATTLGAILVKFLDLWGTVLGTAALSVCTSIGAVLILRTMRRTGERIKTQIAALSPAVKADQARTVDLNAPGPGGDPTRVTATAAVPAAAPDGDATRPLRRAEAVGTDAEGATEYIAKPASRKRTLFAIALSSVLVFGLTMGVLLLLGGITGDPGRFVQQPGPENATIIQTPDTDSETTTGPGEDPTEPTPSDTPAETPSETPADEPTEEAPTETPTEEPSGEAPTEEPTSEPTGGADDGQGGTEEGPAPDDRDAEPEAPAADEG
ncbi:hypothetical protein [Glycomyces tenuis]|uniref:hypothetical protein n=1 Tax=Glycomyces tenuis TaxID=58116 RepID=UPI000408CBF3|nr:hypothetical protein [Glycomyces tenuis]